jgi:hypothetical protein
MHTHTPSIALLPLLQANSVCCEDNADALTHHELLLPGHLLCKFLKEKLYDSLEVMLGLMRRDMGVRQPGQVRERRA